MRAEQRTRMSKECTARTSAKDDSVLEGLVPSRRSGGWRLGVRPRARESVCQSAGGPQEYAANEHPDVLSRVDSHVHDDATAEGE